MNIKNKDKFYGLIYGGIIGDIQGLKYEGLKPKYINEKNVLKKTFFKQYSDDTEHLLIMLDLLKNKKDDDLMFEFKKWLFTLPFGIGKATLKSIIKSYFTKNSGVVSQGNGALMRVGIYGLFLIENEIEEKVKNNVVKTHNSIEAIETSILLTKIIYYLYNNEFDISKFLEIIQPNTKSNILNNHLNDLMYCFVNKLSVFELSKKWTKNNGAYGYTIITICLAIYSFLLNKNNYANGLRDIILCGGDTDTNAFVYGIISGTYNGKNKIPLFLQNNINHKLKEKLEQQDFKINYFKLFLKNIIIIPFVFIEMFYRYLTMIIKYKI